MKLELTVKNEVTSDYLRHFVADPSDLFPINVVCGFGLDFAPDSLTSSVQY
jgi:hypothetical protein